MHKQTGDEYFDSKEFHDLLSDYEQATEHGQPVLQDADELTSIAEYYQTIGLSEPADKAIGLALSLAPGDAAPLSYKIREALDNDDIDEAERLLGLIVDQDDAYYQYSKVEILLAQELPEDAERYLRGIFRQLPPEEYQDFVIDVANIFSDYGYSEKAMLWMSRARQEDTPDFKELMARTLFGLGKYKDSARIYDELIDRDPFSKRYWTAMASAQYMSEEFDDSLTSSEYALAIDPDDPDALLSKANALFRKENFEEAADFYQRYLKLDPDNDGALLQCAICLHTTGDTEGALGLLEKALDIARRQGSDYEADILCEMAFVHGDEGRVDEALQRLDETERLACDKAHIDLLRGHLLLTCDRQDEAYAAFAQAYTDSGEKESMLMNIAVSFYETGYQDQAYSLFLEFFKLVDDDWNEGYSYMALCCRDLKLTREFLKYLKLACQKNPKEAQYVLGHLFPEGVKPEDYYAYIIEKMRPS